MQIQFLRGNEIGGDKLEQIMLSAEAVLDQEFKQKLATGPWEDSKFARA
jgi:hypothetical protein